MNSFYNRTEHILCAIWHESLTHSLLWALSIVEFKKKEKHTTYWKPVLLPSSDKQAPNLINCSDGAILSHRTPYKNSVHLDTCQRTNEVHRQEQKYGYRKAKNQQQY